MSGLWVTVIAACCEPFLFHEIWEARVANVPLQTVPEYVDRRWLEKERLRLFSWSCKRRNSTIPQLPRNKTGQKKRLCSLPFWRKKKKAKPKVCLQRGIGITVNTVTFKDLDDFVPLPLMPTAPLWTDLAELLLPQERNDSWRCRHGPKSSIALT